jgi:hypothetical protein
VKRGALLAVVVVALAACGSGASSSSSSSGDPSAAVASCRSGITYDIAKSKFAFGGTPIETTEPDGTKRYTGPNGVMVIRPFGHVATSSNASDQGKDWSDDADALTEHVREYFISLGASACQMDRPNVTSGSSGRRTIHFQRAIEGLPLVESIGYAQLNASDQSDMEGIYWPEIPAEAVDAARAFRDRIATAEGLAAYKETLPADARGDGTLVMHHTSAVQLPGSAPKPFAAMATWEVLLDGSGTSSVPTSFDENGQKVDIDW